MHRFRIRVHIPLVPLSILALLLAVAMPALAGDSKPRVVPVDEQAFGKSYEEWSAAWWQWVSSLPTTNHPLMDGTGHPTFDKRGSSCHLGQKGKVWFLAGTFGGDAERTCTVPNGKALLIPIFNLAVDNLGPPIRDPQVGEDVLTAECLATVADPDKLSVKIDGKSLPNLEDFAIEPYLFSYTVPDIKDNIYRALFDLNFAGDVPSPGAVSCGYYVLVQPLAKGTHHITIEAEKEFAPGSTFALRVDYDLTVSKSRQKGD